MTRRPPAFAFVLIVAAGAACTPPRVAPAAPVPGPTAADALDAADRLIRAGCYDCLASAHATYVSLEGDAAAGDRAATGAFTSAALLAMRERDLGLAETTFLDEARAIAARP